MNETLPNEIIYCSNIELFYFNSGYFYIILDCVANSL